MEGTAARPPLPEVWARAGWNPATDPIVVMRRRSERMMFSEFFMLLLPETGVTGLVARLTERHSDPFSGHQNVIAA